MKQKRSIGIIIISLLCVFMLTGCTNSNQSVDNKVNINNNAEKSPIEVDDIEFVGLEISQPDSIGQRYIKTKIKNNSNLTITSIRVELKIGDKETTYISSNKTLNPGQTSDDIKCFGPKSGDISDIEAKSINIKVNEDGKMVFVDYDTKLGEYNVLEANIGKEEE
ncbi:putative lipoprotein [[Clostridium] bifermentans ATCC 638]|uniref:Putative lipoprotein n=1 Tax=Paraclostridium bifermentans ATCC 638 = DSM 14991 TaxID=1233171 RepID=T4VF16_PARBF|nr:hypothetical protein [Paraclostridium bifermentans]EQK42319.1 putative lipoprotein [[Clostridium] bifermentans ATCC 638] [Paraclostridium bifermentans ATCC 638 = DSM 14991]RIZ59851.1 hypothetical protein CHH45_02720 [Paraclostridium bifermentans]UAG19171.1 hypothetical protein KXZ80_05520 [Paraclostridium bifermentans]